MGSTCFVWSGIISGGSTERKASNLRYSWLLFLLAVIAVGATLLWGRALPKRGPLLTLEPSSLPADGNSTARFLMESPGAEQPRVTVAGSGRVEEVAGGSGHWEARIR